MSTLVTPRVHYPDSDGERMADNTIQFDWIARLKWNADGYFRFDPAVFVAGDHLIYPVEGKPSICQAPDVYVAFGPTKKDRGSYKVWEEHGVFPQVVFEVWSPSNRFDRMRAKFEFYERYGAEEYYILYPEPPVCFEGWLREGDKLVPVLEMNGHVSPRLKFRFEIVGDELRVLGPDGRPFRTPTEIIAERELAERERERAEREWELAERERELAERQVAEERRRAKRLEEKLRKLGIDPDTV